jgi:single-strand DNA-binding protein
MDLNKLQIIGRITKQLEPRITPSGALVLDFSVATNYRWKSKDGQKQEEVEFHNVVCFGKTAETIAKYFSKGDEIYLEGRLETNSWTGQDGVKRYKTSMIIEEFKFGQKANPQNRPAVQPVAQPAIQPATINTSPVGVEDDPFFAGCQVVDDGSEINVQNIPF